MIPCNVFGPGYWEGLSDRQFSTFVGGWVLVQRIWSIGRCTNYKRKVCTNPLHLMYLPLGVDDAAVVPVGPFCIRPQQIVRELFILFIVVGKGPRFGHNV